MKKLVFIFSLCLLFGISSTSLANTNNPQVTISAVQVTVSTITHPYEIIINSNSDAVNLIKNITKYLQKKPNKLKISPRNTKWITKQGGLDKAKKQLKRIISDAKATKNKIHSNYDILSKKLGLHKHTVAKPTYNTKAKAEAKSADAKSYETKINSQLKNLNKLYNELKASGL